MNDQAEAPKLRKCNRCLAELPRSSFYKNSLGYLFAQCKVCVSAERKAFYQKNKALIRARCGAYTERNLGRSRTLMRRWFVKNKRRNPADLVIPAWASAEKIDAIYRECRRRTLESGVRYHVDHIVPIAHEIVCGLHCEDNLQILTGAANAAKGDRMWPDMAPLPADFYLRKRAHAKTVAVDTGPTQDNLVFGGW